MKYLIVKLSDFSVISQYESEEQINYGGEWGNKALYANVLVPEGIDHRTHDIVESDENDYDYIHEYSDFINGEVVKYFKFILNETKLADVAAADAAQAAKEAKNTIAEKGKLYKELTDKVLYIIAGHNMLNALDATQIESLKTNHSVLFAALSSGMPYTAKTIIDTIEPDGVLITQEELDHVALEYAEFAEAYPDLVPV